MTAMQLFDGFFKIWFHVWIVNFVNVVDFSWYFLWILHGFIFNRIYLLKPGLQ